MKPNNIVFHSKKNAHIRESALHPNGIHPGRIKGRTAETVRPEKIWSCSALQHGVAVPVDQCVHRDALLAVGAVGVVVAPVVRQRADVEDAVDLHPVHLADVAEDGGDASGHAAVELDGFDGLMHRVAGGDGGHEDDAVPVLDEGLVVVPEDELTGVGVLLRGDDSHLFFGVQPPAQVGVHQHPRQQRADDLGAVHTEDGVHRDVVLILPGEDVGHRLGLTVDRLHGGQLHKIVDVGVVGDKMARDGLEIQIRVFVLCIELDNLMIQRHKEHLRNQDGNIIRHSGSKSKILLKK